jgi:hypothetical protein
MGLYLAEGGESNKILGVTCRHVLFGPQEAANIDYISAPRKNVQLLSTTAFTKLITSIKIRIALHALSIERYEDRIKKLQKREAGKDADDDREAEIELKKTKQWLDDANEAIEELGQFHARVEREWGQAKHRVIGHVLRSPAIGFDVGPEGFTEDYAVFELERSKFEKGFRGNVIDLGAF